MKTKRILSFVCVLALVLTMCSVFSFATSPGVEAGDGARANTRYVVKKTGTYMYNSNSTSSGYKFPSPIPVGSNLVRYDQTNYNGGFYKMTYQSYTGYVLASNLTEVQ